MAKLRSTRTRNVLKKVKILLKKTKPIRPLTSFNLYFRLVVKNDTYQATTVGDKFRRNTYLMREAGRNWRCLPVEVKNSYTEPAATTKPVYYCQMLRWKSVQERFKKPCSGYLLFLKEFCQEHKTPFSRVGIVVGTCWRQLDPTDKDHFLQRSAENWQKYEEMIEQLERKWKDCVPTARSLFDDN